MISVIYGWRKWNGGRGVVLFYYWCVPGAWPWIVLNFLIFILQKQKERLIKSFIGYKGYFPEEQQPVTWSFFPKTARKWKKLGTEEIRSGLNPSMYINSFKIRSNNVITTKSIDDCRNTFSKFTIVKIAESIDICFTPNLTNLSINSRKNNMLFTKPFWQEFLPDIFFFSLPYRILKRYHYILRWIRSVISWQEGTYSLSGSEVNTLLHWRLMTLRIHLKM